MEGGEYEVTGQGGLDGDLRGFEVTNLTDENDVWILAEEGAQGSGKV